MSDHENGTTEEHNPHEDFNKAARALDKNRRGINSAIMVAGIATISTLPMSWAVGSLLPKFPEMMAKAQSLSELPALAGGIAA